MAAGDSKLSICSDALIMLGGAPLTSFNDGSDAATVAERLYGDIRNSLMVSYPWAFTIKKVQLAQSMVAPINEWLYSYPLPSDRINMPRAVFDSSSTGITPRTGYEIFGENLYSDYDLVYIDYQYDPGEDKYPSHFVQLLKYWLAWHFAEPVTDQISKAQYWQAIATGTPGENARGGFFRVATNIDGQGQTSSTFNDFDLIGVRS